MDAILQWLSLTTWTVRSTTPYNQKNAQFALVFPIQTIFDEFAAALSISFAPGLWEISQSAAPPTIEKITTLSACAKQKKSTLASGASTLSLWRKMATVQRYITAAERRRCGD